MSIIIHRQGVNHFVGSPGVVALQYEIRHNGNEPLRYVTTLYVTMDGKMTTSYITAVTQ